MTRNTVRLGALVGAAFTCISTIGTSALAAEYPTKPIKMLIGFRPGGGADTLGRLLADALRAELGQPVVVINRPGAGGGLMATELARSKPDGYLIGVGVTGTWAINPLLSKKARYTINDATFLTGMASAQCAYIVRSDSPYKSLADIIAAAKSGKNITYVSVAPPGRVVAKYIARTAGINFKITSVKSGAGVLQHVVGGHADFGWSAGSHAPHLRAGKVRVIAATSAERLNPPSSDVPTLVEQGFNITYCAAYLVAAPKGLPQAIQAKLISALKKAKGDAKFKALTARRSMPDMPLTGQALKGYLQTVADRWKSVLKVMAR